MKVISLQLIINCLFILLITGCDNERDVLMNENYFVRFGLLVNTNGIILEYPTVIPSTREVASYTHLSTKTIKIPVVLTQNTSDVPTDIFYTVTTQGNYSDFQINHEDKITMAAGQLIDTIRINFNSRWRDFNVNKIKLKITNTSNKNIGIGWPNKSEKMDELTITLGPLDEIQYFFVKNRYDVVGVKNEELLIPIQFSEPVTNNQIDAMFEFIKDDIVAISSCETGIKVDFDYLLEREPLIGKKDVIYYRLKILEESPFPANLRLQLNEGLAGFKIGRISQSNIVKPQFVSRSGNPAANFYNLADNFYRTFGKAWYADPVTGNCRWSSFNTFTKPVPVPAGSEFDNGSGFHKYQIAFVGNNLPTGTNPFDFTRFYGGAKVSSPAFTISQALEFFPENGNSTTKGIVKVVPQVLIFIKTSDEKEIKIPICGSGNYYFSATNNRWEIYLEVHCDETVINGNSDVVRKMYIYSNNNNTANPPDLPTNCSKRIML